MSCVPKTFKSKRKRALEARESLRKNSTVTVLKDAHITPYANLTETELTELCNRFVEMDTNGDNQITEDEFSRHFGGGVLGKQIFRAFDQNHSGALDVREFIGGIAVLSRGDLKQKLAMAFRIFDTDKDGKISREEMYKTLASVSQTLSLLGTRNVRRGQELEDLCDKLFGLLDSDNSGYITQAEFAEGVSENEQAINLLGLGLTEGPEKSGHGMSHLAAKKGQLPVTWGDPQWAFVLSMMVGMRTAGEFANANAASFPGGHIPKAEFRTMHSFTIPKNRLVETGVEYPFIDYAPQVFRALRACWDIDEDSYLNSLGPSQIFVKLLLGDLASLTSHISAGKSGSLFFHTPDGKFLAKTIPEREFVSFLELLPDYYAYVHKHRKDTLLMQILGLHRIQDIVFVVISNVLNTPNDLERLWDLKGSSAGRTSDETSLIQKDNNLKEPFDVGVKAQYLKDCMSRDTELLAKHKLMDYSLLVGVHRVRPDSVILPNDIVSSDKKTVYYIGVIDYLTKYTQRKKFETMTKSMVADVETISAVPPKKYAVRFVKFMKKNLSSGDAKISQTRKSSIYRSITARL